MDTLQIGSLVYSVGIDEAQLTALKTRLAGFPPIAVPVDTSGLANIPTTATPAFNAIKLLANETASLRNKFQATGEDGKVIADRLTVLRDNALQAASGFAVTSDEYKKLTLIAAQAERTITGINGGVTRLGIGYQVSTALQQNFGSSLLAIIPGGQSVLDLFNQMGGALPPVGQGLTAASVGAAAGTFALAGLATGVTALVGAIATLTIRGIPEVYALEKAFSVLEANGGANAQQFANDIALIQGNTAALGDTFSKSEIGGALAEIIKAGADSEFAAKLIANSTTIIAAEGGKLNEFSTGLKQNLANFGLGVESVEKTANSLAKAAFLANTGVTELSRGLNVVGDIGAGFTIEQTLAALVELDSKGLNPAEEGATGLRSALSAISGPTDPAIKQIKALGINLEEFAKLDTRQRIDLIGEAIKRTGARLEDLTDLGDTRALSVLIKLSDGYGDLTKQIENSEGALDSIGKSLQGDSETAAKRYAVAVSDLSASLAGIAVIVLNPIVGELAKFVTGVELAIDPTKRLAAKVVELDKAYAALAKSRNLESIDAQISKLRKREDELIASQNTLPDSFNNGFIGQVAKNKYKDNEKELEASNSTIQKLLRLREDIIKNGQKPLVVDPIPAFNSGKGGLPTKSLDDAPKVYTASKLAADDYKKSLDGLSETQLKAEQSAQRLNATNAAATATRAAAAKDTVKEELNRKLLSEAESKYSSVTAELAQRARDREAAEKKAADTLRDSNKAYKDLNNDLLKEISSRNVTSEEVSKYRERLEKLQLQYGGLSPVLRETSKNLLGQAKALEGVAEKTAELNKLRAQDNETALIKKVKSLNAQERELLITTAEKAVTTARANLESAEGSVAVKAATEELAAAKARLNTITVESNKLTKEETDLITESNRLALQLKQDFAIKEDTIDLPSTIKFVNTLKEITGALKDGKGTQTEYATGITTIDKLLADNTLKLSDAQVLFLKTTKANYEETIKGLKGLASGIFGGDAELVAARLKPIEDKAKNLQEAFDAGEISEGTLLTGLLEISDALQNLGEQDLFKRSTEGAKKLAEASRGLNKQLASVGQALDANDQESIEAREKALDEAAENENSRLEQNNKDALAASDRLRDREIENAARINEPNTKENSFEPEIVVDVPLQNAVEQFELIEAAIKNTELSADDAVNKLQDLETQISSLEITGIVDLEKKNSLLKKITEEKEKQLKLGQKSLKDEEIQEEIAPKEQAGNEVLSVLQERKRQLDKAFASGKITIESYRDELQNLASDINTLTYNPDLTYTLESFPAVSKLLEETSTAYVKVSNDIAEYAENTNRGADATNNFIKIVETQKDVLIKSKNAISAIGNDLSEGFTSSDAVVESIEQQVTALETARNKLIENGQATDLVDKKIENLNMQLMEFKRLMNEGSTATEAFKIAFIDTVPKKEIDAINKYIALQKLSRQGKEKDKQDGKDIKEQANEWINYANSVTKAIKALKDLKDGKGDVIAAITDIASVVGGIAGTIIGGPAVGAIVSSAIGVVGSIVGGLVDFFGDLIDPIGKAVDATAKRLGDSLSSSISGVFAAAAVKKDASTFSEDFSKAVGKDLFKEILASFLKSLALQEQLAGPIRDFSRAILDDDPTNDDPALAALEGSLVKARAKLKTALPKFQGLADRLGITEEEEEDPKKKKEKKAPSLVSASPSASIQVATGADFKLAADKLSIAGDKMILAADRQIQVASLNETALNKLVEALKKINTVPNGALRYGN